jgi:hypothetical protein
VASRRGKLEGRCDTLEVMAGLTPFEVDRGDPRAPPMEVWERLSPDERRRVVDMLPADVPRSKASRLLEQERQRAERAEQRIAKLEAELERLRRERE